MLESFSCRLDNNEAIFPSVLSLVHMGVFSSFTVFPMSVYASNNELFWV